jgi:hypothetical protein
MEAVLQRMVHAGIPTTHAVHCYGFLITYAMGFATYQAPRPWGRSADAASAEERRQRMHFYAALPLEDFPMVVELAGDLAGLPSDEQFAWGLEAFVDATVRSLDRASSDT